MNWVKTVNWVTLCWTSHVRDVSWAFLITRSWLDISAFTDYLGIQN